MPRAPAVNGRNRHILTDTLGLRLAVAVTAANADDGTAAPRVLRQVWAAAYPRRRVVYADRKYHNHAVDAWMRGQGVRYRIEVVSRPDGVTGFHPLAKRWVVERTFAWLGRSRALSKDYERTPASSEAWVKCSAIHLMLRRLRPPCDNNVCHQPAPRIAA